MISFVICNIYYNRSPKSSEKKKKIQSIRTKSIRHTWLKNLCTKFHEIGKQHTADAEFVKRWTKLARHIRMFNCKLRVSTKEALNNKRGEIQNTRSQNELLRVIRVLLVNPSRALCNCLFIAYKRESFFFWHSKFNRSLSIHNIYIVACVILLKIICYNSFVCENILCIFYPARESS